MLKKLFTIDQISKLTLGEWGIPNIKRYTRGVKTEGLRESGDVVEVARNLVASGLKLEDVSKAISFKKEIDEQRVSLEEIGQIIRDGHSSGLNIHEHVSIIVELRQSNIPVTELGQLMTYRKSLEEWEITTHMIRKLVELVSKFGNFDQTMEALKVFRGLQTLQSEVDAITATRKTLEESQAKLELEIGKLEDRLKLFQSQLLLYQKLEAKGFGEDALAKLEEGSRKYGGPENILDAINEYDNMIVLRQSLEEKRLNTDAASANLEKLRTEHAHLSVMIAMCKKLVELDFTLAVILQIYDVAKKYGKPVDVLDAIGQYGKLPEILSEKDRALARVEELEGTQSDYNALKRQLIDAVNSAKELDRKYLKFVSEIMDELHEPRDQRQYSKELGESKLPSQIEQLVMDGVTRALKAAANEELTLPFKNAVMRQVKEFLQMWPRHLIGKQTDEKIKKLRDAQYENPYLALKGDWTKHCCKCKNDHTLRIVTVYDVRSLLRRQVVSVHPEGLFERIYENHSVTFSLSEIVTMYLVKRAKSRN